MLHTGGPQEVTMTEVIEANFHAEAVALLQVLFRSVLKYFGYRKTREALAVSNEELARTKAGLHTCQNTCRISTRGIVGLGLFVILLMFVVEGKRQGVFGG
jgi:hypothetical protein